MVQWTYLTDDASNITNLYRSMHKSNRSGHCHG